MIGNQSLNREDLDFCKRQTASGLLRKNEPEQIEGPSEKLEVLKALLSDPFETLRDRISKRGARRIASNSAGLLG